MAGEPTVTLIGNLGGDPDLRFTPSGKAVASFSIAHTPRTKNQAGEWEDGEPLWVRCSAWDQLAENVAETLTKGARVIVTGRLSHRSYETKEGEKRTSLDLQVDGIGPELRFATAAVTRTGNNRNSGQADGWSTAPAGNMDDPPF